MFSILATEVRDHIPLEQGLRRGQKTDHHAKAEVRDHIPLEQELRRIIGKSSSSK